VNQTTLAAIAGLLVWFWGVGSLSLVASRGVCRLWQAMREAKAMKRHRLWPAVVLVLVVVQLAAAAGEFSKATNYMSARGYARWLQFQQTKVWR
jgi:hypothetical protein